MHHFDETGKCQRARGCRLIIRRSRVRIAPLSEMMMSYQIIAQVKDPSAARVLVVALRALFASGSAKDRKVR